MDEIKRVLRPDGTVWFNLSDTYGRGSRSKDGTNHTIQKNSKEHHIEPKSEPDYQNYNKTLMLIPYRFAIGCLDRNWKVRNDIIWAIRNRKPECLHPNTKVIVKTIEGDIEKVSLQKIKDKFDNYTYIYTPNGWKEMLNIWEVQKDSYREIEFGKVGKVICGEDHLFPIGKEEVYNIKAKDLAITGQSNSNHALWNNFNNVKLKQKNRLFLSEITSRDIHNGFIWSNDNKVKSSIEIKNYENNFIDLDYKTGLIFGLCLIKGEFDILNHKQLTITLHEKEFVNKVIVFFNERGLKPKIIKNKGYETIQFSVSVFDYFINHFINSESTNKSININNLLRTSIGFIKGFVQGCSNKEKDDCIASPTNFDLIDDIQTLFLFNQDKANYNTGSSNDLGYQLKVRSNEIVNKPIALIDIEVDGGYFLLANGIVTHNSVRDRFSRKHEYIFFMVKQDKYFFDLDSIKDPLSEDSIKRYIRGISNKNKYANFKDNQSLSKSRKRITDPKEKKERIDQLEKRGKNPGNIDLFWETFDTDLWDIPNKGNKLNHYAAYPQHLITKIIKAGCPKDGIILDPFAGTSTTGIAAITLGRQYIGFDGSKEYVDMSNKRLKEAINNKTKKLF